MKRPRWPRKIRSYPRGTKTAERGADQAPEVAWQAAIDDEFGFWRKRLANKGERFPGSYERLFNAQPREPESAALLDAPIGSTVERAWIEEKWEHIVIRKAASEASA